MNAPAARSNESASNQSHYIELTGDSATPRVDSRVIAEYLGIKHKNVREMIQRYKADFRGHGKVPFQTEALPSGQYQKFALLNEDQAYLLLTFSRNTANVRRLKSQLVKVFSNVRKAAELRHTEYLPTYHGLHDRVAELAGNSPNARFAHMNVNKLVNKHVGIQSGQRHAVNYPQQALLIVLQEVASQAMQDAADHKTGYAQAKSTLQHISATLAASRALGVSHG